MSSSPTIIPIEHPLLPSDVAAAARTINRSQEPELRRSTESLGARSVIAYLVAEHLGTEPLRIEGEKYERPQAWFGESRIHISMAHSSPYCAGVISRLRQVGIDLEPADRAVHPDLKGRMLHPEEKKAVHELPAVRIWTLKEAVLKWNGTGLRTPMNAVRLSPGIEGVFDANIGSDGPLQVISQLWNKYWVAVAFDRPGAEASTAATHEQRRRDE